MRRTARSESCAHIVPATEGHRVLRWIKQRRRTSAAAGIVTAAAVALGVMAFTYDGFRTTDVDLHDGGVWVTRGSELQVGHLNAQAQELDGAFYSSTADVDLLQDDTEVVVVDRGASTAALVDVAGMVSQAPITLPAGATVAAHAGTAGILSADGLLWVMRTQDLGHFNPESMDPVAELGTGAAITVDRQGTLHAASIELGELQQWRSSEEGFALEAQDARGELRDASGLVLTAVGEDVVALDAARGTLYLPGGVTQVPEGAVLQQPGDDSDRVLVATPEQLIRQPLNASEATISDHGEGGEAVRPVAVGGCEYAAWASTRTLVRDCDDDARDLTTVVEGSDGSQLAFRENRGIVVLNQVQEGTAWLLTDELVLIDNWEDLVPPESQEETDEEDESSEDEWQHQPPQLTEENTDPVATDDNDFGARTGRSTILPVLWNDYDQDGDVLTIEVLSEHDDGVVVAPIANDSQLQLQLPPDFSASEVTIEYRVHDGRGGNDDATVRVDVRADGENAPPEQLRSQSFTVEQRADFEINLLQDWFDPDGDDLVLQSAVSASGDTVEVSPSGRIVYTATGEAGETSLGLEVGDGTATATGEVAVTVVERGKGSPIANADFVATMVGQEAVVEPLLNDYAPSGATLSLAQATSLSSSLVIETDTATGTIRVVDGPVGSHYVQYTLVAGAGSAFGLVRVDIREPVADARPVAVRDIALLPRGGETLVDLVENDVDPAGGLLVVRSVQVESDARVTVQLLERRLLRIVDNRGLEGSVTLSYQVSNGEQVDTGTVVVTLVEPPESPAPPSAVDDQATLREGDFTSVAVTENDFSRDNTPFEVTRIVESSLAGPEEGVVFVSGDTVRVHVVEGGPSTVTAVYEIVDETGQAATATLAVTIVPRDPEVNSPPAPEVVHARVLAGERVRIPIPLQGIDRDGDGVQLVRWETAPSTGRITETLPDAFVFEADPASQGTVSFRYRVRDRWGAEALSTVIIGIAQPGEINNPPFAESDEITVRPDRLLAVPVLDNDSDPDGDALTLVSDGLELGEGIDEAAVGEQNTVDFRSPAEPGTYSIVYTVRDARGLPSRGTLLIEVSAEAALVAPRAKDDTVEAADAVLDEVLDVPVLENDVDEDGDPSELSVEVVTGPGVAVEGAVQIVPGETFQVVTYRVTDQDGLSSEAFVFVPAVVDPAPRLISTEPVLVPSGVRTEFELADHVWVSTTNAPRITSADTVSATNANGDQLVIDESTLQYTSDLGYRGPAVLSLQVTDGPDAESGNVANLQIPIEVTDSSAVPPTFSGVQISVEAGGAETSYDLRLSTDDLDGPEDVNAATYTIAGGSVPGVQPRIVDENTFVASAARDAAPGTSGSFQITITDPAGNSIPGTVIVTVVPSTREFAQARPDSGEMTQLETQQFDVLTNDHNPFERDNVPLRIVSATSSPGASVSTDGTRVSVDPNDDFAGILTVQYLIEDGTRTVARQVSGTLTVTVKGRPDAPLRANVEEVGNRQARLSWAAPADRGDRITHYVVTSTDGRVSQECTSTSCTIEGLQNDSIYRFQVTAVNGVGASDPSPPTIEVRPDVRPEQPAPPSAVRGDTALDVSWTEPVNEGSAITHYLLRISPPAPNGAVQVEVQGLNHRWEGLANGTAYQFSVQAVNRADEPSDFSALSTPAIPAGPPGAVASVTAQRLEGTGTAAQMRVSWGEADPNGDAITTFRVDAIQGGSVVATLNAGGADRSLVFEGSLPTSTTPYSFRVTPVNTVGPGAPNESAPVRGVNAPGAPSVAPWSGPNPADADGRGIGIVTVTAGATNGARADEVQYIAFVNGTRIGAVPLGRAEVPVANGSAGTITVQAVSTVDGVTYQSPASNGVTVRPYGPIGVPIVSAKTAVGSVTFTWNAPSPNGRPVSTQIRIDNGPWENVNNQGSRTETGPSNAQITISVRSTTGAPADDNGSQTETASASGNVEPPPPPPPSISLSEGGNVTAPNGQNGTNFVVSWDYLPVRSYTYECHSQADGMFRSGTWTPPRESGTSSRNQYTFCMSGYDTTAWFVLIGGGERYETTRVKWN